MGAPERSQERSGRRRNPPLRAYPKRLRERCGRLDRFLTNARCRGHEREVFGEFPPDQGEPRTFGRQFGPFSTSGGQLVPHVRVLRGICQEAIFRRRPWRQGHPLERPCSIARAMVLKTEPHGRRRPLQRRRARLRALRDRQGPRRRVHRPRPELPPERPPGRLALQGAHAPVADALRRHALGRAPAVAAASAIGSCSSPATPCRSSTRRWRCSTRLSASDRSATGDPRYAFPDDGEWALTWELLLKLRRRGGLAGHAEMEGKTLFLKFNTGPSGHGMAPAAGEALALKHAGADEVKVFVFEGEGGLTPGGATRRATPPGASGLDNLVFLIDWNDFGIDERPLSCRRLRHARRLVRDLRLAGDRARSTAPSGRTSRGPSWKRRAATTRKTSVGGAGSRRARAAATASTTTRATARRGR